MTNPIPVELGFLILEQNTRLARVTEMTLELHPDTHEDVREVLELLLRNVDMLSKQLVKKLEDDVTLLDNLSDILGPKK